MRSWPEVMLVAGLLGGCGTDQDIAPPTPDAPPPADTCATSYLRYDNFGEPFSLNWCRGCHGSAVPAAMRQKAPLDVNFDSLADLRHWKARIMIRAGTAATMPPAGGPSAEERALLVEWLGCGAR